GALGAHEQRVAVGRRARDVEPGQRSVLARAVFDHDALLECGAEVLSEDASDRVAAAPGAERNNDRDRLARIALCTCASRKRLRRGGTRSQMQEASTGKVHGVSSVDAWGAFCSLLER